MEPCFALIAAGYLMRVKKESLKVKIIATQPLRAPNSSSASLKSCLPSLQLALRMDLV
jgi:hypothetical protein